MAHYIKLHGCADKVTNDKYTVMFGTFKTVVAKIIICEIPIISFLKTIL